MLVLSDIKPAGYKVMFNKIISVLLATVAMVAISGIAIVISGLNIQLPTFSDNAAINIQMVHLAIMAVGSVAGCIWGMTTKF